MRPTSTPKIEHEDNFFIELDFRSFWPTKNNFSFIGIDPTINMSGPPPTGAGYNFCRSCSIELQTWYGKLRSDYYCSHYYSRFNRGGSIPRSTCRARRYNFCRSCSIELQNLLSRETDGFCCTYSYSPFNRGGPGFSCAHPSIKIFHRIKSFFFTVCENGR